MLDDVLDVSGPPERTGKPRGTDLLDGTVTLPLILARGRDPGLRGARPASLDAAAGGGALRPHRGHRRARRGARRRRSRTWREAKAALAELDCPRERAARALELVADGVVERYA